MSGEKRGRGRPVGDVSRRINDALSAAAEEGVPEAVVGGLLGMSKPAFMMASRRALDSRGMDATVRYDAEAGIGRIYII